MKAGKDEIGGWVGPRLKWILKGVRVGTRSD